MSLEIRTATVLDAKTVCAAVRRSITECCEADHRGDTKIIATWLENKTIENVTLWLQEAGGQSETASVLIRWFIGTYQVHMTEAAKPGPGGLRDVQGVHYPYAQR